jgi:hypothetical protein
MATARIKTFSDLNKDIFLEGESTATELRIRSLLIDPADLDEKLDLAGGEMVIAKKFLVPDSAGDPEVYRFAVPEGTNIVLTANLVFLTGKKKFFGRDFSIDAGYSAKLIVRLLMNTAKSIRPSVTIGLCGQFEVDLGGGTVQASTAPVCIEINIEQLFDNLPKVKPPTLSIGMPDFGIRLPKFSIPWDFPKLPALPFRLPSFSSDPSDFPIKVSWRSARITNEKEKIVADITGLRIESNRHALEGDLHLVFEDGSVKVSESYFDLYRPDQQRKLRLQFDQWHVSDGCLLIGWKKGQLNNWLKLLLPDLADVADTDTDITFRILWNDGELSEVRLDWVPDESRTLKLPGVKVDLPAKNLFSLVYYKEAEDGKFALIVTEAKDQKITVSTSFALNLAGEERDVYNDGDNVNKPLISITATAKKDVSIALVHFSPDGHSLKLFKQLQKPLKKLAVLEFTPGPGPVDPPDDPEEEPEQQLPAWPDECPPSEISLTSINAEAWTITFDLPLMTLPFLKQGNSQFIQVELIDKQFNLPEISCKLKVTVTIGSPLQAVGTAVLVFNLETMAFKVQPGGGIDFIIDNPVPEKEFLGLKWTLKPGEKNKLFTLITQSKNYQLRQAAGSVISATLPGIGTEDEPLEFQLRDFALSAKGISVKGRVLPRPVKLAGLNTRFHFTEGEFTIEENKIRDFSIAGSGALPPKLVGEATADIALQFRTNNSGSLELVSGLARLRGKNLLDCKSTRFQFTVDGLGLKFVNDGRYHFYFTITGMAKFVPLPGDDSSGPLSWLPGIEMQLMECPLTDDVSVLSKHIKFLVEMPRKPSFEFLGCFKMELRGIGFIPSAPMFGGDAAMELAGQVMFADGTGDVIEASFDFHNLFIGLPEPGKFFPRIHFKGLTVKIRQGDAFAVEGSVDFFDNDLIEPGVIARGFGGRGSLSIQGLPTFTAAFTFVRVSRDNGERFVRAWFIFVQVEKISLRIPLLNVFIREIGLGFGYRYTLASIRAADDLDDPRKMIKELRRLSLTQGELSRRDQWRVVIEDPGQTPRWTVAARMMISQNSASQQATDWHPKVEKTLSSLFLLDVVLGLRSDLTFLMTARAWLNTNYNDYRVKESLRTRPLLSGFVLLSPRKKRFLAHFASNPGAEFGDHPPLPEFIKRAIRNSRFSATLLIEPGLLHYELGWPTQLSWQDSLGPLTAEFRGGTIFRISRTDIVYGNSFMARGTLELAAQAGGDSVGARISATAKVAYGARYIGVIGLVQPIQRSALYGAVGIEINVRFAVEFWLRFKVGFVKITIRLRFSFTVQITALVELGFTPQTALGVSGRATLSLRIMGRGLHFKIHVGLNHGAVNRARQITSQYLNIGLEAAEAEPIPGTQQSLEMVSPTQPLTANVLLANAFALSVSTAEENTPAGVFVTPGYFIFCIPVSNTECYFLLYPNEKTDERRRQGFLPVPPENSATDNADLECIFPAAETNFVLHQFNPLTDEWPAPAAPGIDVTKPYSWKADWEQKMGTYEDENNVPKDIRLAFLLRKAYITKATGEGFEDIVPVNDPEVAVQEQNVFEDARVYNPSDAAFEAAVRGAAEQFEGSPYFKQDKNSFYEASLLNAFASNTSIYAPDGQVPDEGGKKDEVEMSEQALHLRSAIVNQMLNDFQQYVEDRSKVEIKESVAFQMGLVFRTTGGIPSWLREHTSQQILIKQRTKITSTDPDSTQAEKVILFNTEVTSFQKNVPQFQRVRDYTDANTIAITWDLTWSDEVKLTMRTNLEKFINKTTEAELLEQQIEPEQFLKHYLIRRRPLHTTEAETEFVVKPVEILSKPSVQDTMLLSFANKTIACANGGLQIFRPNQILQVSFNGRTVPVRTIAASTGVNPNQLTLEELSPASFGFPATDKEQTGIATVYAPELIRLRSRFQFTDHFNDESLEDQIALGRNGKTYLYTVIPVDVTGKLSPRPLTLVTTRRANYPPPVPSESELEVLYKIDEGIFKATTDATLLEPESVKLSWKKPADIANQPEVAIKNYRLVFRKEKTLPIGSYGLDTETEGTRNDGLPSSNARVLRTDIIVSLPRPATGTEITLSNKQLEEILDPQFKWKPEAWRVFLQTEGENDVLSPIVPVSIVLCFERKTQNTPFKFSPIKRMPELLEWVTRPVVQTMLEPEDSKADVDLAAFPMPSLNDKATFRSAVGELLTFKKHPEEIRVAELLWNQSPSKKTTFPTNLQSGYQLYEFDVDAHTADAVDRPQNDSFLQQLRRIREVELLSGASLDLSPDNTTIADQWEAWYPGMVSRMLNYNRAANDKQPQFSKATLSPWFSWRESYLEWVESPLMLRDEMELFFAKPQRLTATNKAFNRLHFRPGSFVRITGFPQPENNGIKQLHSEQGSDVKSLHFVDNAFKAPPGSEQKKHWITIEPVLPAIDDENLVITADVVIEAEGTNKPFTIIKFTGTSPQLNHGEFIRITDAAYPSNNGYRQVIINQQNATIQLKGTPFMVGGNTTLTLERSTGTRLHPFLYWLTKEMENENDVVELNAAPPFKLENLELLQQQTSPAQDPYGWNILKTLGLSVSFSIRDRNTGKPRTPQQVREKLIETIDRMKRLKEKGLGLYTDEIEKHLFIEYLFKPSKSTRLEKNKAVVPDANDLLSLVQVSLRPVARQVYKYRSYKITKRVNEKGEVFPETRDVKTLNLKFKWTKPARGKLIEVTRDNAAVVVDAPAGTTAQNAHKVAVEARFSAEGEIRFILHCTEPAAGPPTEDINTELYDVEENVVRLTDWQSQYFDAPVEEWKERFKNSSEEARHWQRLACYLISVNPAGESSLVPPPAENTQDVLNMMKWVDRFFTASADIPTNAPDDVLHTKNGINIASAYPRVMSPTALSPDAAGRLTYYHRIEDGWAHVYRYYFLPQHRYDKLLETLANAVELFPEKRPVLDWFEAPKPESGGLDVVIDRIKDVAAPVVLSSGRLDETVAADAPVKPGKTWEVIIAKHPEQLLIERNRTLVRQLEYRQMTHTLLRKFAFDVSLAKLNEEFAKNGRPPLKPVYPQPTSRAELPHDMEQPDHLSVDDPGSLLPAVRASLDIPSRLGVFSKDALVLQFEKLPYFYKHLLLLAAQTSRRVSSVTSVVQQDLEYKSPRPQAKMEVKDNGGVRFLQVNVQLNSYRECLPDGVEETWSELADEAQLRYADLPDTEVAYQVILKTVGSNVEAQMEFRYDTDKPLAVAQHTFFKALPLGRQFEGSAKQIIPAGKNKFYLETQLLRKNELDLPQTREIEQQNGTIIPGTAPVNFAAGDLTQKIYYAQLPVVFPRLKMLFPASPPVTEINRILRKYTAVTIVSVAPTYPADFPEALKRKLEVVNVTGRILLTALSPLNQEERDRVRRLYPAAPDKDRVIQFTNDLQNRDAYNEFFSDWFSEEPVTGKKEFTLAFERIEFPVPASCVLSMRILKKDRIAALTELQNFLREPLDHSFAAALVSLAKQLANFDEDLKADEIAISANACVGIEQLAEIAAPGTFSVDAANKKFTWQGLLTEEQKATIRQWIQSSDFGVSFQRLLDAAGTGAPSVTIEITEKGWLPRPQQLQLPGILKDHLLIGHAVLRWWGWMTVDEAKTLSNSTPEVNKKAVHRLFAAAGKHGLNEAAFAISARRGTAANQTENIQLPQL